MTASQIEAMPERMAAGMLAAYCDRKAFEAKLIANAVWSVFGRRDSPEAAEEATDTELSEYMDLS